MLRMSLLGRPAFVRRQWLSTPAVWIGLVLISGPAMAAVSQTPLFLAQPPKPNIMFTLDNSGSMQWETVTGLDATAEFNSSKTNRAFYSSSYNQIYYNPATTYSPGVVYDGTSMGNSTASSARIDPYPLTSGTVDLTATCYAESTPTLPLYNSSTFATNTNCYSTVTTVQNNIGTRKNPVYVTVTYDKLVPRYAFYYVWKGTGAPDGSTAQDIEANFTRVDISSGNTYPKASSRTDCGTASTCTYDQEVQNFANWFSYYRTRILMTKTAIGLAFAPIDPVVNPVNPSKFRVGFNTINDPSTASSNTTVVDGTGWLTIRDFNTTQKQAFYTKLYAINPNGGTPLRAQMDRIGQLYKGTLANFDYTGNDPYRASASDATLVSCRPSYHIMSTDGFWNGAGASSGSPLSSTSSLADIADYYYKTDLRSGLANNIKPNNIRDTATWQHMTTFTIGLGADGTLPYSKDVEPTTWPSPIADDPTAIDDLWHAAVVGKGRYFSAKNPTALQSGLTQVLKDIAIQAGAASTGAITGSAIDGDSYFYVPSFESGKWIGHLKAYSLSSAGSVGAVQWDAATKLPTWDVRNIVTWNPSTASAVDFSWDNLTSGSGSQQTALTSSDVLEYLKGNNAKEQTSDGNGPGIYRYRANKLGDIVNSAPLYVKKSDFGYRVLPVASGGGTTYGDFLTGKSSRTAMLYAGANDGMLHGFNASTGVETFAFIPNALYPNLVSLSSPDYGHRYYVDGLLTEGDAYLGSTWKTVLLGSVGAGGSGIFAVDVTDPSTLGASKVMWEKGVDDLPDLGRVMGQITAVRLRNGEWGAIFGNGYDSANGKAVLYVLNVSTGALITSFDVDPTIGGNGMSAPAFLFNAQRELVGAYAGDLQGNLWKFDFDNTSVDSWSSSKLFSAVNASKVQPMIKRPAIAPHPNGGYMVTVATGKFIESDDKANVDVQSIYGIWDKPSAAAVTGRAELTQQTLATATGGRTLSVNPIDWTTKRGWYIDLSLSEGERVIGDLTILDNTIMIATTLVPTSDLCQGGGVSQLMALNYLSGGAMPNAVFALGETLLTGLSSVTIAGTVANPAWVTVGRGKRKGLSNPLDGGMPQEIDFQSGVAPYRTWHQIIIKN